MNGCKEFSSDSRRGFMRSVAATCLGVSYAGLSGPRGLGSADAFAAEPNMGKAKHIIYLFMEGAMSHLDTFDPKSGVPEAGETKAIQTRVPGMMFSDRFPRLSYLAGAITVVRSLSTETGAHDKAQYLMRTSYKKLNSIQHPGMGAWMLSQQGRLNRELPGNYVVGAANRHPGAGFLEPSLSPVPIANPTTGIQNVELPKYLPESLFERRLWLAEKFDTNFQTAHRQNQKIEAYNQLYTEARNLMGSEHLKVFDIKDEPESVREAYGDNTLGQGCLLARRLVESGARFVEVSYGGWDMHQDLYSRLDERASHLDNALGILLKDLHRTGLLNDTLVVLTTEFGRKPSINANAGRDHHPGAFCSLLAGAGIKGGQVYGASDKRGFSVDDSQMSVADFNKTIAAAAGLPTDKELFSPNGRPFKIGGDGEVVEDLLA
ncbi:DUF1501 domain-containing protein [Rhodopirellula sp. MGV]|uniref:DUF1501 domain-containing protein n=1 Tax=Rhodopirellula sp. MGV TaxID=2023130 RepID=UPI000B977F9C|nr:DUF1501 domain-containing protein [Rhodopirellula sp. MGV]OYP35248.1 hypothetical protein CGZ80_12250 [Rhodopirellula sp. MGV]PNY37835.1 DUF1501 domain-containing protein [Rhodopirellula baltica]